MTAHDVAYLIAGILSLAAAAIHGGVGERLVVMRLPKEELPRTPFGGAASSMAMIRVTWHIVTLSFFAMGVTLVLCTGLSAETACAGAGRLVAASFLGYFVVAGAIAIRRRTAKLVARHPAPLIFATVAVLAWFGST
jgi:hypothetical protein